MSYLPPSQTTSIATHTNEDIFVRGKSLCGELVGQLSFTQMMFFQILGRIPTPGEVKVVDACLVALMEHGLTPSALATRLTYSAATEAMQGAVAAGLLGVGSLFAGTMDGAAQLIARILSSQGDRQETAFEIARHHRQTGTPLPGFGHHLHKPDDPRSVRVFEVADEAGVAGDHIAAIRLLSACIDEVFAKHITINVTGAIAAALGDCGVPAQIMRGFALITRTAGLVGHIHEEQQKPALRAIWEAAEEAVKYDGPQFPA